MIFNWQNFFLNDQEYIKAHFFWKILALFYPYALGAGPPKCGSPQKLKKKQEYDFKIPWSVYNRFFNFTTFDTMLDSSKRYLTLFPRWRGGGIIDIPFFCYTPTLWIST